MLLCVPDGEIAAAAAAVARGPLVGHCSGATGLEPLAPHEAFSLHPLMTVPAGARPDVLAGAGCAVDGATPRALAAAEALAAALGMRAMRVEDEDRAAYHAAASIAANFLVTLEGAAERLAATAGRRPRAARPARARRRRGLGRARRRAGARPARSRAATRRPSHASAPPSRSARPTSSRCSTCSSTPRGRWSREDDPHGRRDARRTSRRARDRGLTVGLVPTMGAFHAGHHSLMRAARERCDEVVVSLFVNPAQFNDSADLAAYPRSEERDAAEAVELGVDVLYAPPVEEVYPPGFATAVRVEGLSDVLEGAERGPDHFAGVCTVVTKLLNVVTPDVAFFGQKDAQQVAVLRRMVRDLDLAGRARRAPHRARARRPRDVEPQRPPGAGRAAARGRPVARAARRRGRGRRPASATPPRSPPPRAPR